MSHIVNQRKGMDAIVLLLVAALLCTTSQAVDPPLPKLPRYFTTFAEYYMQKNDSNSTLLFLQVRIAIHNIGRDYIVYGIA